MAGPAIGEVLEFDAAIAATLEVLKQRNELENTMIVVTADHETGGLTLVGPYKKTLEQAPVQYNFSSTNHTGIPVMVWAQGPGAQTLNGKNDQTHVFEAMKAAITPQAGMGR
jgi:alkaline phosphatase